jgi:hypothetical protein
MTNPPESEWQTGQIAGKITTSASLIGPTATIYNKSLKAEQPTSLVVTWRH